MVRHTVVLLAAALLALIAGINCDPLTPGNLIVQRFGDGTAAPNLYTAPIFLLEVDSVTGEILQNFTVPAAAEGANHGVVGSFMNVKSGRLSLTPCQELVVFGGMELPPFVAPNFANRVFGSINLSGTIDTSTWIPPATDNPYNEHGYSRGVTANGTEHFWGSLSSTTAYAYHGGTPYVEENTGAAIAAAMQIAGWELYSIGGFTRLLQWGTGMPTSGFVPTTLVEFGIGGVAGLRIVDANPNEPGADLFYIGTQDTRLCKYARINGTWTGIGCSQPLPTWDDSLNTFITDVELIFDLDEDKVTVWYSTFSGIYTFIDVGGIRGPIEGNSTLLVPVTPAANAHFAGVALVPEPLPCCPSCPPTPTPAPCETPTPVPCDTPTPVPCDTPTPVPPPTCTVDERGRRRRTRHH